MKRNIVLASLAFIVLAVMVSCASDSGKKRGGKNSGGAVSFPELKGYKVSLQIISSKREFYPGQDATVTFKLKNKGKNLKIFEWLMSEPDNISVYYRPYKKGLKKFVKKDWKRLSSGLKEPAKHLTLELNKNNSALIDKKLSFIKEIKASSLPGGGLAYYVLGELNLKSIRARSRPIIITVK